MKLEKIDVNFVIDDGVSKNGMKYYNIPNDNFALYGVFYDEKLSRFVRMDGDIASKISEGVKTLSQHTAGGRLRFSTDSSKMEISVTYDELWIISNMAMLGSSGFILME